MKTCSLAPKHWPMPVSCHIKPSMNNAIAIIVGAGSANRFGGDVPKQFRNLNGLSVLEWSYRAFRAHKAISQTIIVFPKGGSTAALGLDGLDAKLVEGGPSRSASVRNALQAIDCAPGTPILIHDAARPGLSVDMISKLLAALDTHSAAAPALPVSDALKRTDTDTLVTVDRNSLMRVQTPQAFVFEDIQSALANTDADLVDDLAAIETLGKTIALIEGDERLHKITYEKDLALMESILAPVGNAPRIGTGYDVHKFGPGDHVTLCGTQIPHTQGLVGHSDADIGWHAATDAILGAIAAGDIGDHFPPSDEKWKDADSGQFLLHAQTLASQQGYAISNLDITLICEAPKIKPHREAMRARTAELLGLPLGSVSVKATTTEGLGFTGRREGIAGQAAVILTPAPNMS